jgi:uncharacterized protein YuzE
MEEVTIDLDNMEVTYDSESDVLYVSFGPPHEADDSELLPNGVVVRYKNGEPIGFTIPGAKGKRTGLSGREKTTPKSRSRMT